MPTVQRHTQINSDAIKTITAAEADRVFAPHTISSAQLGTIIGGTIDADSKITAHSFGSAEMGSIMPTVLETERMIGAKTIERGLSSYLIQEGSAYIGTTRYIAFPTVFTNTPSVTLTPLGSPIILDPISGSAYQYGIQDVVGGSFQAYATPTGYYMYNAIGSA